MAYDSRMDKRRLDRVNLRFSDSEVRRLESIVAVADRKTMGFAPLSQVLKELIGLRPYRLLDESQRKSLAESAEPKKR